MNWDALDFALFGALLLGAALAFRLATRASRGGLFRVAVALAVAAIFLLVWVNGAVGIIGNEGNPANLMFGGVIAVAIVGAAIARFRPRGMAAAMAASALAQMLVAGIALGGRMGIAGPAWPSDLLIATGFFTLLWLGSAWLFRMSAQDNQPAA